VNGRPRRLLAFNNTPTGGSAASFAERIAHEVQLARELVRDAPR
jgi:hypothetical protein